MVHGKRDSHDVSKASIVSLVYLPATPRQRRLVLIVGIILVGVLALFVPFHSVPLEPIGSFIPTLQTLIFVNDLITSILLFAQYTFVHSRAILVLASGYLFTALIVVSHALTFPGAFSPTGLLGANIQTAGWLYFFWHIGSPTAILIYALLKDHEPNRKQVSSASAIAWSVSLVFIIVIGLTWLALAADRLLPPMFADDVRYSHKNLIFALGFLALSTAVSALAVLWARRRSILDYCLMLVALAVVCETIITVLLTDTRYTFGWYGGRFFTTTPSIFVLVLLLLEISRLYGNLARSNMMLERERANKLMNVNAATSSIAHEVRQPLAAITANSAAARRWLQRIPPDMDRAARLLGEIERAGFRASEVLTNVRRLFQDADHKRQPIDVNNLLLETLQTLHQELNDHGVKTDSELASELPLVMGNGVQLQEVLSNLVHNAIDAMTPMKIDGRTLKVRTKPDGANAVIIQVEDSGRGIEQERLGSVFEPFVTTKPTGTGLGLAICSTIIERHGGRLTASSDGKNGALFQIVLPVDPATSGGHADDL